MRGRSFVPPTRPGPSLTLLMTRHPEQRRLRRVSDTPLEPRTRDPSPSARLRMTNIIITSPAAPAPFDARDDSSLSTCAELPEEPRAKSQKPGARSQEPGARSIPALPL